MGVDYQFVNIVIGDIDMHVERGTQLDRGKALARFDLEDVQGVMFGIAQIAWSWGWRPAGFEAALINVVREHGKGTRP